MGADTEYLLARFLTPERLAETRKLVNETRATAERLNVPIQPMVSLPLEEFDAYLTFVERDVP